MTDHKCSETSCPFAFTEESEQIQNYGCLPTPGEIITMRVKHGRTWACHSDNRKPCLGALQMLKERGHEFKVIDRSLLTEESDWNNYIK